MGQICVVGDRIVYESEFCVSQNSNLNYINISEVDSKKAKVFFEKAIAVAGAGQFDFAIDMFLEGLKLDPEAVEAHQQLRDVALRRKVSGGKPLGMFEKMKGMKDMLAAERQLALDPGDMAAMQALMEFAFKAGCYDTVLWIAGILFKANNESTKPDLARYKKVLDHYGALERFSNAVEVAGRMQMMKPEEMDLKNEMKNYSAREAMAKGNYQHARSFRDSIRNMDKQRELLEEEKNIIGTDYAQVALEKAEAELAAEPKEPGKMMKVIEQILKLGTEEADDRALIRLEDFYAATNLFRFRQKSGEIRMRQLGQEERRLRAAVAATPTDTEAAETYKRFLKSRAEEELQIFSDLSAQYPTDMMPKFQMAERLAILGRYNEAIPIYQATRSDPKLRYPCSLRLGRTFLAAEFLDEAVVTLKDLIEKYPSITAGDDFCKDVYYWYGRALEASKDMPSAIKSYSQVMQWDFNYRDVQTRVKKLRAAV